MNIINYGIIYFIINQLILQFLSRKHAFNPCDVMEMFISSEKKDNNKYCIMIPHLIDNLAT